MCPSKRIDSIADTFSTGLQCDNCCDYDGWKIVDKNAINLKKKKTLAVCGWNSFVRRF